MIIKISIFSINISVGCIATKLSNMHNHVSRDAEISRRQQHFGMVCSTWWLQYVHLKQTQMILTTQYDKTCKHLISAVATIVITIFIAIFEKYRIVLLSLYFLCMWDDILAWHFCNASTIDSSPIYSSFSWLSYMPYYVNAQNEWVGPGEAKTSRPECQQLVNKFYTKVQIHVERNGTLWQ